MLTDSTGVFWKFPLLPLGKTWADLLTGRWGHRRVCGMEVACVETGRPAPVSDLGIVESPPSLIFWPNWPWGVFIVQGVKPMLHLKHTTHTYTYKKNPINLQQSK